MEQKSEDIEMANAQLKNAKLEDIEVAKARLKNARLKNKKDFDKRHRLRSRKIVEGDWVLVYDNSLDNQHSTAQKFSHRWFGPYLVKKVEDNATYRSAKLDGTSLALSIAGKRNKIFKRRDRMEIGFEALDDCVLGIDEELEYNQKRNLTTIGTYRWMCRFGGGELRVILHTRYEK